MVGFMCHGRGLVSELSVVMLQMMYFIRPEMRLFQVQGNPLF